MERLHFRATSLIDLQSELRERDLLRHAEASREPVRRRVRAMPFGLRLIRRRHPG